MHSGPQVNLDRSLICISVVSHRQGAMINHLLEDLSKCSCIGHIFITQNVSESQILCPSILKDKVTVIKNERPQGFSANHNRAFTRVTTDFFAVLNPDVRLSEDPFPLLLRSLALTQAGVISPAVVNSKGTIEQSARKFPTPLMLLRKCFGSQCNDKNLPNNKITNADWLAGMFMIFPSDIFRNIGGFDEGYYLYYEDVDICARLWNQGSRVVYCPQVKILHDAQRASRRNFFYFIRHVSSMTRYFMKYHFVATRTPRSF